MKLQFALLVAASGLVALSGAARCADAPAPTPQSNAAEHPWEKDEALLQATIASVRKYGMKAVGAHASDLEMAVARARSVFEIAARSDDKTDGSKDSAGAADKPNNVVIPEPNPYPGIGFFLGTYYDESGKPQDGLRILEVTLDLPGTSSDPHLVDLLIERGAAYAALKQWDNALASYEDALKPEGTAPGVRAYIYRGKGLVLVEMGRMAEGKITYEEELKLTVNDPAAQRNLDMIEQLRDGGPKQPGQVAPSPAKP